jgi:hypothetical protein
VPLAPPVGGQAAMTAVKAAVPAPHLATYDLQAFQDGVRKPFFGSPWVPPPKAVTTTAQAAVPPAQLAGWAVGWFPGLHGRGQGRCAGRPSCHLPRAGRRCLLRCCAWWQGRCSYPQGLGDPRQGRCANFQCRSAGHGRPASAASAWRRHGAHQVFVELRPASATPAWRRHGAQPTTGACIPGLSTHHGNLFCVAFPLGRG